MDGSEQSADLIEVCRGKSAHEGFEPNLYVQAMHAIDLLRRYRTILVVGSFGLMGSRRRKRTPNRPSLSTCHRRCSNHVGSFLISLANPKSRLSLRAMKPLYQNQASRRRPLQIPPSRRPGEKSQPPLSRSSTSPPPKAASERRACEAEREIEISSDLGHRRLGAKLSALARLPSPAWECPGIGTLKTSPRAILAWFPELLRNAQRYPTPEEPRL